MSDSLQNLFDRYGALDKIPDPVLYEFITREDVIKNIRNKHSLGLDILKKDHLVQEVRRRCEQDLYWLGRYFLWDTEAFGAEKSIEENMICEHVHRRVADMFIKKDKTKKIGQQDWRKDRLILYPRYTMKSTFDRYDVVQWVLNFPDIRILYLTAEQSLAEGFVGETKSHFYIRPDNPSLMNLYFPEFCFLEKDSGPADMLTCPLWAAKQIDRKEPTVWGSSVISTLSGKHFEVIKADDAVSDENSNNDVQCKKITEKFNLKRKMLLPTGYVDKIGTRYADEDMYGEDLRKNVGNIKREGFPSTFSSGNTIVSAGNWEIMDNEETGLRVLIGRSIVIKPEVAEKLEKEGRPVTYAEAGPDGCNLLFPEHHTYKWCMKTYTEDERIFEGQQNQNPRTITNTIFDRPLMLKHTIPFNDPIVPQTGPISQFWDFAFSSAKGRDYSTGSCVIWNEKNQLVVIDLIRAKYKPFDLAKAVVEFAVKYKPFVIGIEKAAGSELIGSAIITEAYKTKLPEIIDVCSRIDWVVPSNQKDAKATRMRALHPLIAGDLMYFVSHLPYLETLYDEFERCLTSHHHDDIPDNLAYQPLYAPRAVQAIATKNQEMFSRADGSWQYVFDASGELYGQGENYYNSPFKGYVLINDPETGEFRLVGEEIINPIVVAEPAQETRAQSAYDGLDNVLGAGLIG